VVTVATRLGIGLVSGAALGIGVGKLIPRRRIEAGNPPDSPPTLSP